MCRFQPRDLMAYMCVYCSDRGNSRGATLQVSDVCSSAACCVHLSHPFKLDGLHPSLKQPMHTHCPHIVHLSQPFKFDGLHPSLKQSMHPWSVKSLDTGAQQRPCRMLAAYPRSSWVPGSRLSLAHRCCCRCCCQLLGPLTSVSNPEPCAYPPPSDLRKAGAAGWRLLQHPDKNGQTAYPMLAAWARCSRSWPLRLHHP